MKKFLLAFLIFTTSHYSFSQCVKGRVTDSIGKPIKDVSIFALDISKATISNIEGNYKLQLPKGKHTITVQHPDYKTKELKFECSSTPQKQNIILEKQVYKTPQVRILNNNENPAFSIMQKAIAISSYYRSQVEEYNCKIYLKGSATANKVPGILKKSKRREYIKEGKANIIEKYIDLNYKQPNNIETNIIAIRSSMDIDDRSPMNYISSFIYHNDIDDAILPLDRDAFIYYYFRLDASFYDQDHLIHRIKVIPRYENNKLYSGYIFIVDKLWSLYSVQLQLEQKTSTININSRFMPVSNNSWMPVSYHFDINTRKMGMKSKFKLLALVSEYDVKLNPDIDYSFYKKILTDSIMEFDETTQAYKQEIQLLFQKEILAKKEAKKLKTLIRNDVKKSMPKMSLEIKEHHYIKDTEDCSTNTYWDSIRPVSLTIDEKSSYLHKDSLLLRMKTDTAFKDSIKKINSQFKWFKILKGGNFIFNGGKHQLLYGGLFDKVHIDYNTTEGFKYGMEFTYSYYNERGKHYRLNYDIDYAFGRERMTHDIGMMYRYNGIKQGCFYLAGGTVTSDMEGSTGIPRNLNLMTTLFLEEDYLKVFQKDYIEIAHKIDITNGLDFLINFEYAQRKKIMDYSDLNNFISQESGFLSNDPTLEPVEDSPIGDHIASIAEFKIRYTPKYYYRIEKGAKIYSHSNYPTFTFHYFKGINGLFNSNVDFDRVETSISQNIPVRRLGSLNYELTGGSFINNNRVYFADYKRFGTNRPIVMGTSHGNIFRLIDYSEYSTNQDYFETHIKLSNDRILLKRLPFLSKTLINENLYFSTLHTTGNKPYYEMGYGLNKIFKHFNLEVFAGFKGNTHEYSGIKLCVPFIDMKGITITDGM